VPPRTWPSSSAGCSSPAAQWIDYVSYCGGMPLYVKRVYPDPRWFDAIVAAVEQFEETAAEMVAAYEPPPPGCP
jgi:hypothetical protein